MACQIRMTSVNKDISIQHKAKQIQVRDDQEIKRMSNEDKL